MAILLAVLCALAAGYCLVKCLDSRWRYGHGVGLDAWHVAMGVVMAWMLLGSEVSVLYAVVFGVGAAWCAWSLWSRDAGVAYLRLGVASAAMALMLAPTTADAAPAGHVHDHHHSHGPGGLGLMVGTALVGAAVVVAVAALVALRSPERSVRARLGLGCEVVMALALGWMAATGI